ncbi:hypothetical protein ACQUY5_24190 [Bacillus cereus]|uniref:hypothetical protein n=1 Tax=Bacillus cereus TaxID=1396 RepID=UPI003D1725C6
MDYIATEMKYIVEIAMLLFGLVCGIMFAVLQAVRLIKWSMKRYSNRNKGCE